MDVAIQRGFQNVVSLLKTVGGKASGIRFSAT